MFRQDACSFRDNLPGAEFALADGAAAFRAQAISAIVAGAPRLPLRFHLTLPVNISAYDRDHGQFTISLRDGTRSVILPVFGSRLDIRLPSAWAATEAEARAYLATQTTGYRQAWLGLDITIAGTVPGYGSARMVGPSGCPTTGPGGCGPTMWRCFSTRGSGRR
jgi:hypothetical protein